MRSHRYLFAFYHLCDILGAVVLLVADIARLALRVDYGHAWRVTRELGITAFRQIAKLSPVYQSSYDTHGLSLNHRMRN